MQQGPVIKNQKQSGQNTLSCFLSENSLIIQVFKASVPDKIYYTVISKDSFPQNLTNIIDDIQELYSFLTQQTPSSQNSSYELPNPNQLVLVVPIKNRVKKISIYLTEKPMTRETMLQKKIVELEQQVNRLKAIQGQYIKLKEVNRPQGSQEMKRLTQQLGCVTTDNERMRKTIIKLQATIETNKNINSEKKEKKILNEQEQDKKIIQYKSEIVKLHIQNTDLKNKIIKLEESLQSYQFMLKESNQQNSQSLIKQMALSSMIEDSPIINPQGSLLVPSFFGSPNSAFYIISSKSIKKGNTDTTNQQGRFLPAVAPIPSTGRHYIKMKLTNANFPLNAKLGLITRTDLQNVAYINSGSPDIIMYSSKAGTELIFEGVPAMEGFPWKMGQFLAILIDQDTKQVEWHLQGQHIYTSPFTEPMKIAPSITFFVQLHNNGDSIQFANS